MSNAYDLINDSIIIGSGGAGTAILDKLIEKNKDLNYAMVVSSKNERKRAKKNKDYLHNIINLEFDGTGKKPMLAFKELEGYKEETSEMVKDYRFVFHICGFGGGTGVGTAMNIARNNKENKLHMFLGTIPHLKLEGLDIYENTIDSISKINKANLGRFWLFDNNYTNDKSYYEDMNQKVVKEINYMFNLPSKNYGRQDIDTSNLIDILFPNTNSRKGIITTKRMKIDKFNSDINIKELFKRDISVSYDYNDKTYNKIGFIVKLGKEQTYDENIDYIDKIKLEFMETVDGTTHPAHYFSNDDDNEITIIYSSPIITNSDFSAYKEISIEKLNNLEEKYNKEKEDELSYSSNKGQKDLFNTQNNNGDDGLFDEEENDPFENIEEDFNSIFN
ncbi:MAG: hypothetical protein ACOCV1_03495 [Bacillota bacterium]